MVADLIKEHAARRVDLYFYALVALYNTKIQVNQGDTILQHGKGSTAHQTHACHSSFFPTLVKRDKKRNVNILLFSTTQFFNNLNSTVELPRFVSIPSTGHLTS